MRIRLTIVVALMAFPAALRGAPPAPPPDPCRRDGDGTACYVARQADYLGAFGLPTLESRSAAGDQVRRVMIFGRSRNPVVAIEFRRAAGAEPIVAIYGPRGDRAAAPAQPAYAAAVPLAEWERLGEAGRNFDRTMVPDRPADVIVACADGWLDIVETTDLEAETPGGRLRRRVEGTCAQGLANAYARELADTAVRLLPACRGIEGWQDFSPMILAGCAMLGGDRMAAAQVYSRLTGLRDPTGADGLRPYFAQAAVLDWAGERIAGAQAVAAAWMARTVIPAASFFPRRLVGENAERVRVEGVFERWADVADHPSVLWIAPVSLVLVRGSAQTFDIVEAQVGAFAPAPHYCDHDSLERHCR